MKTAILTFAISAASILAFPIIAVYGNPVAPDNAAELSVGQALPSDADVDGAVPDSSEIGPLAMAVVTGQNPWCKGFALCPTM